MGEIEYPDLLGKRLSPKKQSPIPPADFERSVIVHDFDNIGIRDEPRVPASSPGRPPVVRNVPIRYESSTAGRRATENSENSVRSSASNFSLDSLGSTQPSSELFDCLFHVLMSRSIYREVGDQTRRRPQAEAVRG